MAKCLLCCVVFLFSLNACAADSCVVPADAQAKPQETSVPEYGNTDLGPAKVFYKNGILQPGETQTGAETAVGGYRIYACQTNYLVRGSDGAPITGVVNG